METASYRNFTGTGAENYERYFVPAIGSPVSHGLLDAAALQAGERVLDVGCGTGIVARKAATAVGATGSVTGVDVAADMIAVAAVQAPPGGAQIEWREGRRDIAPVRRRQLRRRRLPDEPHVRGGPSRRNPRDAPRPHRWRPGDRDDPRLDPTDLRTHGAGHRQAHQPGARRLRPHGVLDE